MNERAALKLHIGCGQVKLPGFVNIDLAGDVDLICDVRQGLPYEDHSVDFIFSEHFIEHLNQAEQFAFLRECRRVLKDGGVLRIATPDLRQLAEEYLHENWHDQPWLAQYGYEWVRTGAEYLNVGMRYWGHQWLLDQIELRRMLCMCGFADVEVCPPGQSAYPDLRGLETRDRSFVLEATRRMLPIETNTLVTIVIPAWRSDFLDECIQSARTQTYPHIEILVLDDSPGQTVGSIAQRHARDDPRVRYIKNSRSLGEPDNLTQGIRLARGDLIKPLYDDDLLVPDAIEQLVDALRAAPGASLAVCLRTPIDEHGRPVPVALPGAPSVYERTGSHPGPRVIADIMEQGQNWLGEPTVMLFHRQHALSIDEPNVMSLFGRLCFGIGDVCLATHLLSRGDLAMIHRPLARFRLHTGQTQRQEGFRPKAIASWSYLREHTSRIGLRPLPRPAGTDVVVHILDKFIQEKHTLAQRPVEQTPLLALGNLLLLEESWQTIRERLGSIQSLLFLGPPEASWVPLMEGLAEARPWLGLVLPPGRLDYMPSFSPDWQVQGWLTQDLKLPRERFDCIVCHGYLELASEMQAELQVMRRLLEPDGQLVLILPNAGSLRRLDALLNQQTASTDRSQRLFTRADIEDLMASAGYRVTSWYGLSDPRMPELDPAQHEVATGRLSIRRVASDDYAYLRAERFLIVAVPDTQRTVLEQDPAELYALWRATHEPAARERVWMDAALATLAQKELFHLASVLWDEGQLPPLYRTLASLGEQLWEHWRVSIFAPFACPENLTSFAPVVSWYEIESEARLLEQVNRVLCAESAQWVGQIEAGDRLAPHALFALAWHAHCHPKLQALYSDEDQWPGAGEPNHPYFKPDFDIDYLRAAPYAVGGVWLIRRALFDRLGGYRSVALGVENYDLQLRTWEAVGDEAIGHVADILYHRDPEGGHALQGIEPLRQAQRSCLEAHLARCNLTAIVSEGALPGTWRVDYALPDPPPLISILIPNKDSLALITRCIERLLERTEYLNYEIVVIDNGSDEAKVFDYYRSLEERLGERFRWVKYDQPFNYAAMINLGAAAARGAYHLHLNNDVIVTQPDWLSSLLLLGQRPDVGVVGARLLYPDGRLQHAGLVLGLAGLPAEHAYIGQSPDNPGHFGQLQLVRACSAVTGACLLLRREVFDAVQGMDAGLPRNFNDVDLCLRVRKAGWRVLWTPHATLIHDVNASRWQESIETQKSDLIESTYFMFDRWQQRLAFDPCYNRHLSLRREQAFFLELTPELTLDPDWRPAPRVLAHPADRAGCGEYRIIAPMRALNRAGRVQGLETGTYLAASELWRMQPDSIVLQRQVTEEQIELIDRYAKLYRAPRVFEIDDLITNVPIKSPVRSKLVEQTDLYKRFRRAVKRCDRLVVSTDYLAETYRTLGPPVVVVPNHLEGTRWLNLPQPKRREGKPRVGWAGASQHHGDLAVISEVVKATADKVDWVFLGMCLEEVRPWVREFHPGVPLDDYPAKLASLDLDLAVAPLEDVPFNHAKSHLRLLEYGVLGYPVLCTDITPYRGDYPVTRVPNRFKSWHDTLLELVSDREALRRAGQTLREYILRHWILEAHLDRWLDAWLVR